MEKTTFTKKRIIFMISFFCLIALLACVFRFRYEKLENKIIREIDQQCGTQNECFIMLSEITDFEWDTVTIFVAGGDPLKISDVLGLDFLEVELRNGIVFQYKGEVVKKLYTSYDYLRDIHPQLEFWIEDNPAGNYYRSYSYSDAYLRAKKIEQGNGKYRYVLIG